MNSINRRDFLSKLGGVAAVCALPQTVFAASPFSMVIPTEGIRPPPMQGPVGTIKPFGSATASSFKLIDPSSIDLTSSPAGATWDIAAGGVFFNQVFYGDFSLVLNINPWPGLNAGILGLGVMDASDNVYRSIVEFASYPEWIAGAPFGRVRYPYAYNSTNAPLNSPLNLSLSRSNGVITGVAGWPGYVSVARQLSINIPVKPFIYYVAGGAYSGTLGKTAPIRSISLTGS